MKKVFKLTDEKKAPARQVDAVKHEINKYLARERRKTIAESEYWDFDCKFGNDAESAIVVHVSEINKKIDAQVANDEKSFYVEIIAKALKRMGIKK